jgi:DNA-binding transcriptional LysR family regulator
MVLGILVLWAGAVAAATAVAGVYYARSHQTPYTGTAEIIMAAICAVVAPWCLAFKSRAWLGWNRRALGLAWAYWLAYFPFAMVAAALSQPWSSKDGTPAAVEAGRGVALVQEGFQCLAGPRLAVLPLAPAPPPFVLGVAWRKGVQSGAVDNFIAAVRRAKSAKRHRS